MAADHPLHRLEVDTPSVECPRRRLGHAALARRGCGGFVEEQVAVPRRGEPRCMDRHDPIASAVMNVLCHGASRACLRVRPDQPGRLTLRQHVGIVLCLCGAFVAMAVTCAVLVTLFARLDLTTCGAVCD